MLVVFGEQQSSDLLIVLAPLRLRSFRRGSTEQLACMMYFLSTYPNQKMLATCGALGAKFGTMLNGNRHHFGQVFGGGRVLATHG